MRQEEQSVELTGVPHHSLSSSQADQGQDHDLEVGPLTKGFAQGRLGGFALRFHFGKRRRLVHAQADVNRNAQQQDGHNKWHAPAPISKGVFANSGTGTQNDHQGQEQAQSGRGLNPRGVSAALAHGRMLGNISSRTTVLTTQGQALKQTQDDQNHRSGHANGGVGGQDTHDERGQAHDQNGDQEGVLPADHVAQASKEQSAEGAHNETSRKRQQRKNEGRTFIQTAEELLGNDGCQRTVQIKVVPLKHRTKRRSEDDLLFFRAHRTWGMCCCHVLSPNQLSFSRNESTCAFLEKVLTNFLRITDARLTN